MAVQSGRATKGWGWFLGLALAVAVPALLAVLAWRTTPVAGGWAGAGSPNAPGASGPGSTPAPIQAALSPEEVYRAHCARCHGASMEGTGALPALKRPGWPYAQNRDLLVRIIHQGRGLTMPGYEGTLSNRQIEALADWIQATNGASAP